MLDRFVELEIFIRSTLELIDNPPESLIFEEWTVVKELIQILQPFEEATKVVSGEKYMTASVIIIIAEGLQNVCNEMLKKDFSMRVNSVLEKLISEMVNKDRWRSIEQSKTLRYCTFLDPRFNDVLFSTSIKQCNKTEITEQVSNIIFAERSTCSQNSLTPNIQKTEASEMLRNNDDNKLSIWKTIDEKVAKKIQPTGTCKSRSIIEIQRYLEEPIQNRTCDPLQWLADNSYNYPYLSQLARKRLCCLGTSVPCERVFSKAGLLVTDRRCSLSKQKVDMLLYLNQSA